jgi:hypothetical protein
MSRATLRALGIGAALLLAGCQINPAPRTTSLRLNGTPRDARVSVDDQKLGALAFVAEHGVALPPGRHRVTVEKPGYFPYDKLVVVEDGDPPVSLAVTLEKIPD